MLPTPNLRNDGFDALIARCYLKHVSTSKGGSPNRHTLGVHLARETAPPDVLDRRMVVLNMPRISVAHLKLPHPFKEIHQGNGSSSMFKYPGITLRYFIRHLTSHSPPRIDIVTGHPVRSTKRPVVDHKASYTSLGKGFCVPIQPHVLGGLKGHTYNYNGS